MLRADLTWKSPPLNRVEIDELVHADWNDPEGPVRLARDLADSELSAAILLGNSVAYLGALAEAEEVALTTAGNLKVDFVKRLRDRMTYANNFFEFLGERKGAPREPDVHPLREARRLCEAAGLTQVAKGRLSLTEEGRELLVAGRRGNLFRRLFVAYFTRHPMHNPERTPERRGLLRTLAFTLFTLKWELADWTAPPELALKAFLPSVQEELLSGSGPFSHLEPEWALTHELLEPLHGFGLLECRFGQGVESYRIVEARKVPLFDRFLAFGVPRMP
jgi:hypothetical protein